MLNDILFNSSLTVSEPSSFLAKGLKKDPIDEALLTRDLYKWRDFLKLETLTSLSKNNVLLLVQKRIAEIDRSLNTQINEILHNAHFQRLEASWRGLYFITQYAGNMENVKVKVLNVTWREISHDLEDFTDFDKSYLFQKIYTTELDMPGGEPFGLLLADYAVQHHPSANSPTDDVTLLTALSKIAACAFAPVILSIKPAFLGLESFDELQHSLDLQRVFSQPEYARWNSFRQTEDSRFIGLVFPRVLMRVPYKATYLRHSHFCFKEIANRLSDYLWGSPVFCFATVVMRSFNRTGWFADIRGMPYDHVGGGMITDLPCYMFNTDKNIQSIRYPVEMALSLRKADDFSNWGLMALTACHYTPYLAVYYTSSLHQFLLYHDDVANANARLAVMLQYILCVSRFAHYLKVILREKIGTFSNPADIEAFLQRWLMNYVTSNDDTLSAELGARYPLREATVKIQEQPFSVSGFYKVLIYLLPHFQLERLSTALHLVTELVLEGD